jgi:PAS domain S-box-containing protein
MEIYVNIQTQIDADMILEQMPVCVALFDIERFLLLRANTMFHTSLDAIWRDGHALGRPVSEWLPDADANGIFDIFRSVVATGNPLRSSEFVFPSFERGVTYWSWTLSPLYDGKGNMMQLLLTAIEITEQVLARQQTEQAHTSLTTTNRRVEAEKKLLTAIETVARSVRQSLDIHKVSAAANAAISANCDTMYVFTYIADPVQKTLHLLTMQPELTHKEYLKHVRHIAYDDSRYPTAQAYRQRTPIVVENMQGTTAIEDIYQDIPVADKKMQGYICAPLWFGEHFEGALTATFKRPIDANGFEVQTLVGCSMHIAAALAHARMHDVIESERAKLRAILDQLPESILITESTSGTVSYVNTAAARIFGTDVEELIGLHLHQLPHIYRESHTNGRSSQPWNFMLIRALAGETINGQEITIVRPDGSRIFVLSSIAPLRSENNVITGAVIVFQDISAQKRLEKQRNDFLSIASHELRTPITAIQGFAEILQFQMARNNELDPQSIRALSIILEQSEQLCQLIEEMLDITRLENVQMLLTRAPHDLINILKHVIEAQTVTTKNHHIELVLEGLAHRDTLTGNVDENRLMQVLSNLIGNAIKYSPGGGTIEVGLRYADSEPNECLIWVKDAGLGIPAADLPDIFKRFHRSNAVDRSVSGLGIGLYLVKELVTRHSGSVWVESTEGNGSTFYVKLPLDAS